MLQIKILIISRHFKLKIYMNLIPRVNTIITLTTKTKNFIFILFIYYCLIINIKKS